MSTETPSTETEVQQGNPGEEQHQQEPVVQKPVQEPRQSRREGRRDRTTERIFTAITKGNASLREELQTHIKGLEEKFTNLNKGIEIQNDPEPKLTDFQSSDEYAEKKAEWLVRDKTRKATPPVIDKPKEPPAPKQPSPPVEMDLDAKAKTLSTKFGVDQDLAADFIEDDEELAETEPEYAQVMSLENLKKIPSSPLLFKCLVEDDDGAKLRFLLCKNPEKAAELSKMKRSRDVVVALDELRAELDGESTTVEKEETPSKPDPKAPIAPVKSGRGRFNKTPAQQSDNEYFAKREAEVRKNKRLF